MHSASAATMPVWVRSSGLEDVGGRVPGNRPSPSAISEVDEQQLVLEASKGTLGIIVDAERPIGERREDNIVQA